MQGCVPHSPTSNAHSLGPALAARSDQKQPHHCARTVPESNVFDPFELSLSEKQIPDLLEMLVIRSKEQSCWSRVPCAQGSRPPGTRGGCPYQFETKRAVPTNSDGCKPLQGFWALKPGPRRGSPLVRSPAVQAASTVSFKPIALATANKVDRRGLPLADNAR